MSYLGVNVEFTTFFRLGPPQKKCAHWLPGRCSGTYKHPSPPYLVESLPFFSFIISIPRWCTTSWACIPSPSARLILLMLIMTTLFKVCSLLPWCRSSLLSDQLHRVIVIFTSAKRVPPWQCQNILKQRKINQEKQQALSTQGMSKSNCQSANYYLINTLLFHLVPHCLLAHLTRLESSQVSYPGLIPHLPYSWCLRRLGYHVLSDTTSLSPK